jgi:nucleoside-diphosphate-sugar epimerase
MSYVVTGATGFLGKRLAKRLAQEGKEVIAAGRNEKIGKELTDLGVAFRRIDLSDSGSVKGLAKGAEYFIHCAALSSPWGSYDDFYSANVVGTINVLNESLESGVRRFVHVSTPSIYFDFKDRYNVREEDPLPCKPANDYAKTKLMAEKGVRKYSALGLDSVIIRPRGIFGEEDNAIFPRFIKANGRVGVPFIDGGKAVVDITYVGNVVDALVLCCDTEKTSNGQVFNITNGEPQEIGIIIETLFGKLGQKLKRLNMPYGIAYSLAAAAESISRITGKEPLFTRYSMGVLSKSETLDISKARAAGYVPKVSIDEGLERVAAWWKQK